MKELKGDIESDMISLEKGFSIYSNQSINVDAMKEPDSDYLNNFKDLEDFDSI